MTERSQIETWVEAARGGDRSAATKLLAACHARLRARAEARMPAEMRSKFSPDDILQEVYLDVFQRVSSFDYRGPGSFINWIFTILDRKMAATWRAAHTKVRDVDREVSFRPKPDESSYWSLLDQVYTDSGTPSRAIRREEAFTALVACLSDLSENHRQVIQLRFLEGAAVSEVAERLGRSEGAVVALTKRALVALRESMDNMGDFTRGA